MTNPLIEKYGKQSRWVTYQMIERDRKITKVPFQVDGSPASSTDESTWRTYEELGDLPAGIVFKPDRLLLGIDIDKCLEGNNIIHEKKETIAQFIIEADTYCEVSPSGAGLHLFLELTESFDLEANRKAPFELYTHGRYFTFTGNSYKETREVRTVTPEVAIGILSILGYPWKSKTTKSEVAPKNSVIETDILLHKIFNSKNGSKFKQLYDGDVSLFNGDESAADMSLCSSLAFWTGKNAEQMEKIWLSSPLGSREKTQSRQAYRASTIDAAIESCREIYETTADRLEKENPDLDLLFVMNEKKDKIFIQNTENMYRILEHHGDFKGRFRYDEFKCMFEIKERGMWRQFEDADIIDVQTAISILFPIFGKVGKDMVFDAIIKCAKVNSIDSAVDYVKGIAWDRKPRLDTWLTEVVGAPKDHYHRAVGANWIKGMVKRIVEPGCKFDYVMVLEGPQGSRKSSTLAALGGSWHVETTMSTDSKDFFMQMQGKLIVEFSEGETLSRTEVKKMKAIITTQVDRYRPSYGRVSQDFPRRCVFAMTTNQDEYLKDETGNRRWLPVKMYLEKANVEWVIENRSQLYAEAYYRLTEGKETIYEFPEHETFVEQDKRRVSDPQLDNVIEWYHNKLNDTQRRFEGVTIYMAYRDVYCGGFASKSISKYEEMAISNIFKTYLKLDKRRKMVGGIQSNRWFDPKFDGIEPVPMTTDDIISHAMDNM